MFCCKKECFNYVSRLLAIKRGISIINAEPVMNHYGVLMAFDSIRAGNRREFDSDRAKVDLVRIFTVHVIFHPISCANTADHGNLFAGVVSLNFYLPSESPPSM